MVVKRKAVLLLWLLGVVLPGALSAGPDGVQPGSGPLVITVLPYLSAAELHRRFDPLAAYLGERLGRPVQVTVAASYDDTLRQIGAGEADIAFLGPAPYVRLVDEYGPKRLLARLEVNGEPTFHGYVVTREDSPIDSLDDLAGHAFAFGDAQSTMSHLVPRAMLIEAGVPVARLARSAFLNSHDNVALGVLAGDFDAGAMMGDVYHTYRPRGLRAVAMSPPISELLFVAADRLGDEFVDAIRSAMFGLQSAEILSGIKAGVTRLVPVTDSDCDSMRELLDLIAAEEESGGGDDR